MRKALQVGDKVKVKYWSKLPKDRSMLIDNIINADKQTEDYYFGMSKSLINRLAKN